MLVSKQVRTFSGTAEQVSIARNWGLDVLPRFAVEHLPHGAAADPMFGREHVCAYSTGNITSPTFANDRISQFGLVAKFTTGAEYGAVPPLVEFVLTRRPPAQVLGPPVGEFPSRSMTSYLATHPLSGKCSKDQNVNWTMLLSPITRQFDCQITFATGSVDKDSASIRSAQFVDPWQRLNASPIRYFVKTFVANNGKPDFHRRGQLSPLKTPNVSGSSWSQARCRL